MLELILDECKQDLDLDSVFEILNFRIRPKIDIGMALTWVNCSFCRPLFRVVLFGMEDVHERAQLQRTGMEDIHERAQLQRTGMEDIDERAQLQRTSMEDSLFRLCRVLAVPYKHIFFL